jgi:hypothetical protein
VKRRPLYLVDEAIGFEADADIVSHPAISGHQRVSAT